MRFISAIRKRKKNTEDGEKGAIIVEATISLSVFMFLMFTLLSLIQIAYVQSRMTTALCAATKQVAQYTHVFYALDLDSTMQSGSGKSSELFGKLSSFLETVGGNVGAVSNELGEFFGNLSDATGKTSLSGLLKSAVGDNLVKTLMKKNLETATGQDADAFLRNNRVEDLSLIESSFLESNSNSIYMRVTYRIRVAKFFGTDVGSFYMSSCAYTGAWGK